MARLGRILPKLRRSSAKASASFECATLDGSVLRTSEELILHLGVQSDWWREVGPSLDSVIEYYRRVAVALNAQYGSIYEPVLGIQGFYGEHGMSLLPRQFGTVIGWATYVTRPLYEICAHREDLVTTPARKLIEYDDGALMMIAYDDPLRSTARESLDQVERVSRHIEACIARTSAARP
ncbi:MAG: hypothetical protein M5U28_19325 [Sandaracinaceae bacterium]|nr:hypothetical protein [Sandaracinaceae bacterium]